MCAHEIVNINGKNSMAYVGSIPWHGLGQNLTENASIETWLEESGMNFSILSSALYFHVGVNKKKIENANCLYRDDNNVVLSPFATDRYKIVQPRECLEFFREFAEAGNMIIETAGVLSEGRKYWALARIVGHDIFASSTDKVKTYMLLASSADKSLATLAQQTDIRVVCNNTLTMATNNSKNAVKVSHSMKFDKNKVKNNMGLIYADIAERQEKIVKMHNTVISLKDATKYFLSLLLTKEEKKGAPIDIDSKKKTMPKMVNAFLNAPGNERTVWGALNAVTYAIDHNTSVKNNDTKMASAWFGVGAGMKQEAWQLASNSELLERAISIPLERTISLQ